MGFLLYLSAVLWAWMGGDLGVRTTMGLLCYIIASINFVGGVITFAINDAAKRTPPANQDESRG